MRFYPNREVIEQLLVDSMSDPHLKGLRRLSTSDVIPIFYRNQPVGFYSIPKDGPNRGNVYIEPDYSRNGIAFKAALKFKRGSK